ncbi:hypothetical protein M8C21_032741 [Ambrosia artemisiifolia]|uniref:Uncharacterized protein n=1 Tax=Ambrosia artemisiifolia TaxID=4212 RepID=A0AAD5GIS8_AMBAR|nr:hypothetical protein M8C21_032741 [Ambrosia artemisiifolia]
MSLVNILHMNFGNGESSYANNSSLQETGIRQAMPFLKHLIKGLANHSAFDECFTVADLGCSSGKNTLSVASNIIDIVHEVCQENDRKAPQFQVCLNDLFGNDFNTVFKLLPDFYAKLKNDKGESFGPCFVSAIPGSFYGRLFPDHSLHLVHSANSIHWLSQVPQGLESNGSNIFMAKTSPPNVFQAYKNQFHTDFTKFLQMRSEELVRGGSMIITIIARNVVDPTTGECFPLFGLLGQSLVDIMKEGLVRESDINSFNVPLYFPCEDEVRNVVGCERSFSLESIEVFKHNWNVAEDTDIRNMNDSNELSQVHTKKISRQFRAILEPLLISHFGNSIIDMLFKMFEKHVAEYLSKKKHSGCFLTVSLIKK